MLKKFMFPALVLFLSFLALPLFGAPPIYEGMVRGDVEPLLQMAAAEAGLMIDTKNFVYATQNGSAMASAAVAGIEDLQKEDFLGGRNAAIIYITTPVQEPGTEYWMATLDGLQYGLASDYYVVNMEYIPENYPEPEGGIVTLYTLTGVMVAKFDSIVDTAPIDPTGDHIGYMPGSAAIPHWKLPRFTFCWAWGWGWRFFSPWWYYWYYPLYPYYLWWNWGWWGWHFDWHWRWWGWGLHIPYIIWWPWP